MPSRNHVTNFTEDVTSLRIVQTDDDVINYVIPARLKAFTQWELDVIQSQNKSRVNRSVHFICDVCVWDVSMKTMIHSDMFVTKTFLRDTSFK